MAAISSYFTIARVAEILDEKEKYAQNFGGALVESTIRSVE